jgi:hypothetical protein
MDQVARWQLTTLAIWEDGSGGKVATDHFAIGQVVNRQVVT